MTAETTKTEVVNPEVIKWINDHLKDDPTDAVRLVREAEQNPRAEFEDTKRSPENPSQFPVHLSSKAKEMTNTLQNLRNAACRIHSDAKELLQKAKSVTDPLYDLVQLRKKAHACYDRERKLGALQEALPRFYEMLETKDYTSLFAAIEKLRIDKVDMALDYVNTETEGGSIKHKICDFFSHCASEIEESFRYCMLIDTVPTIKIHEEVSSPTAMQPTVDQSRAITDAIVKHGKAFFRLAGIFGDVFCFKIVQELVLTHLDAFKKTRESYDMYETSLYERISCRIQWFEMWAECYEKQLSQICPLRWDVVRQMVYEFAAYLERYLRKQVTKILTTAEISSRDIADVSRCIQKFVTEWEARSSVLHGALIEVANRVENADPKAELATYPPIRNTLPSLLHGLESSLHPLGEIFVAKEEELFASFIATTNEGLLTQGTQVATTCLVLSDSSWNSPRILQSADNLAKMFLQSLTATFEIKFESYSEELFHVMDLKLSEYIAILKMFTGKYCAKEAGNIVFVLLNSFTFLFSVMQHLEVMLHNHDMSAFGNEQLWKESTSLLPRTFSKIFEKYTERRASALVQHLEQLNNDKMFSQNIKDGTLGNNFVQPYRRSLEKLMTEARSNLLETLYRFILTSTVRQLTPQLMKSILGISSLTVSQYQSLQLTTEFLEKAFIAISALDSMAFLQKEIKKEFRPVFHLLQILKCNTGPALVQSYLDLIPLPRRSILEFSAILDTKCASRMDRLAAIEILKQLNVHESSAEAPTFISSVREDTAEDNESGVFILESCTLNLQSYFL